MLNEDQKSQMKQLLREGKSHRQIAKVVGCSSATIDNYAKELGKDQSEIGQLKQELLTELDKKLQDAVEIICYYIDERLTAKVKKSPANSKYLSDEFRGISEETSIREKLLGGWEEERAKEEVFKEAARDWFTTLYPPPGVVQ